MGQGSRRRSTPTASNTTSPTDAPPSGQHRPISAPNSIGTACRARSALRWTRSAAQDLNRDDPPCPASNHPVSRSASSERRRDVDRDARPHPNLAEHGITARRVRAVIARAGGGRPRRSSGGFHRARCDRGTRRAQPADRSDFVAIHRCLRLGGRAIAQAMETLDRTDRRRVEDLEPLLARLRRRGSRPPHHRGRDLLPGAR